MEYSPFTREIEDESGTNLLQTCRELGVTVVCYSPLGRGLFTGTIASRDDISGKDDHRPGFFPWFSEENFDANVKVVGQLKTMAEKKGCTATQLVLAWIMKQGDDFIPIPGTKRVKYLEENWRSLDVDLSEEEVAEVRKFVESAELAGKRGPNMGKKMTFMDTPEETS